MLLFHKSFKKDNFLLNLNLREIIKFLLNLILGNILYLLIMYFCGVVKYKLWSHVFWS